MVDVSLTEQEKTKVVRVSPTVTKVVTVGKPDSKVVSEKSSSVTPVIQPSSEKSKVVQVGIQGPQGAQGPAGVNAIEELVLEMEMEFKTANLLNYKEFLYNNDDQLITKNIWETSSKLVQLFSKTFTYNGSGQLITTLLTRISDLTTLTQNISYNGSGQLINITRI